MNRETAKPIDAEVVDLEERNWLPRHSRGETQAFEQLLTAYRDFVTTFLWRYGVERQHQDDLFQEIFSAYSSVCIPLPAQPGVAAMDRHDRVEHGTKPPSRSVSQDSFLLPFSNRW